MQLDNVCLSGHMRLAWNYSNLQSVFGILKHYFINVLFRLKLLNSYWLKMEDYQKLSLGHIMFIYVVVLKPSITELRSEEWQPYVAGVCLLDLK